MLIREFKITRKGETLESDYLNPMASSFQIVIMFNLIAIPLAIQLWFDAPTFRAVIVAVLIWCIYNIFMALISLGAFWEKRQVRRYHRIDVRETGEVYIPRLKEWFPAVVRDLSLTGFGLEIKGTPPIISNEEVLLKVSHDGKEEYQFNVRVRRVIQKRAKVAFGAEQPLNDET